MRLIALLVAIVMLAGPGSVPGARAQSVLSDAFAETNAPYTPSEQAGREIWMFATAFNDRFFTYTYPQRLGAVIDFLLVYFRGLSWPAFNVADAAIVIGVLVFLYDNFREGSAAEPGKSADAKDAA